MNSLIKWLLWIERQLHQGSIFELNGSELFSRYIQLLHKMSRNLITLEHNNQRDASNIGHLLRDHERLGQMARRHGTNIDHASHERVRDDLFTLRDLCDGRHRRILNLQRRTSNYITLLYNLITGHDSTINLKIATESAKIAQDARRDSGSMKIIAGVTLLYLPATFVCSLFGTNLIALDTSTDSNEPAFIVSRLWWLYFAFAVPLTVCTMVGFLWWRRFRETNAPGKGSSELGL
jgi:Mg2+ and Co2+ transporter CorA